MNNSRGGDGKVASLQIRKFDPSKMEDPRVVLVIGKRNTGKSVLTKDLLYYKRHIPCGVVMSGTEEGNGYYGSWVPSSFVYNDFDKEAIERVITNQKKLCARKKAKNVFLVLDDCMYDNKILKHKCMRSLFMNGRHWKIFLLVTAQYLMDVPPAARTNIDYVIVLREPGLQNRKKLYDTFFGGVFPTFDMFCAVMDKCTENYECLVLDQVTQSNKLEDVVFWYKATIRDNFKMGSPYFWRFHNNNYDPREEDVNELALASKRRTSVTVYKA